MRYLRQSTVVTVTLGPFLDSTDLSAEEGLTIAQADIRLSKNGGAFAQTANAAGATHMENGYYLVPLVAGDVDTLGHLIVAISVSGVLPVWAEYQVVPAQVYDSIILGSDLLAVDTQQVAGTAQTARNLGAQLDAAVSSRATADDVWDEALGDHLGAGSTGQALNGAGAAGDPWLTALPGAYAGNQAGNILATRCTLGAGGVSHTVTVDDGTSPLDGVTVWVTTDEAGTNVVASGQTNAQGQVTFVLDAGTYYVWCQRTGINFTNPTAEVWS